MYSCTENVINNVEQVKADLATACETYGMGLSSIYCEEYEENNEYSVVAICRRGHVSLHVYKNLGFVAADVFSCHDGAKPSELSRNLRAYFGTDKSKITLLDRGDFGTVADMKPRKNSQIKFVRRTKNLGNKLKKMMLKPRSI